MDMTTLLVILVVVLLRRDGQCADRKRENCDYRQDPTNLHPRLSLS